MCHLYTFSLAIRKQTSRADMRYLQQSIDARDIVVVDHLPVTTVECTVYDLTCLRGELDLVGNMLAEAVAQVGQEAYLWGDAVLAMHNLALVDPPTIKVATSKRVRKELPAWVEVIHRPARAEITYYEGIPAQRVGDALRTCKNAIMPERLWFAVMAAKEKGLIAAEEYQEFRRELNASKL